MPWCVAALGAVNELLVHGSGSLSGFLYIAFIAEKIVLDVAEDTVSFPWFPLTSEPDEAAAYTQFVEKLCGIARKILLKNLSGNLAFRHGK